MAIFQIQNVDGTFSPVSHKAFFETLNNESTYLYYKQGGTHLAMLPTAENEETIRICRQSENAESTATAIENRCRDKKGRPCRYQRDSNGSIIRNSDGLPVYAKCGDCPRDGWSDGKRVNCCIRNYCKTSDCTYCPHPRECYVPHSLEWLTENKRMGLSNDSGGFFITSPDLDMQAVMERVECEAALNRALRMLPPKEQDVMIAVYWNGLSRRAYSIKSGIPATTVSRLHNHALDLLKNYLKDFR